MKNHTFIGIIIIFVGLSILFKFPIFNAIFAIFIIWIGIKIISGKNKNYKFNVKGNFSEDVIERVLVFSGIDLKLTSQNFKGGELVSVFGGGDIDLSTVSTDEKIVKLDVVSIFGGFKIKVPKGWQVKSSGMGIIGAFNNTTDAPTKAANILKVEGVAIFGGGEITN